MDHHTSKDLENVKKHLESWQKLPDDKIHFKRLGGLSNLLWKVSADGDDVEPHEVIYRKFGKDTGLVNREKENEVFSVLSDQDLGPKCFGYTPEYRIEQFYYFKELKPTDVNDKLVRRNIARTLVGMHLLQVPDTNRNPRFLRMFEDRNLNIAFDKKLEETEFTEKEKEIVEQVKQILSQDEIDYIISQLPKSPNAIKFSHNDLHAGNILYLEEIDKYLLIDCEYSRYDFRGLDIANLFIETMFDYTYKEYPYYSVKEENFPSREIFMDFIKYYAFFTLFAEKLSEEEAKKFSNTDASIEEYVKQQGNEKEFEAEVKEVEDEATICALLSHYYWIVWSIIFSKNPEMNFDYVTYAGVRLGLYEKVKERLAKREAKKDESQ